MPDNQLFYLSGIRYEKNLIEISGRLSQKDTDSRIHPLKDIIVLLFEVL